MDESFKYRAQTNPDMIPTMIAELVAGGFDFNVRGRTGRTPLQDVIRWLQSEETVNIAVISITEILQYGHHIVDLNVQAVDGMTALHNLIYATRPFNLDAILVVLNRLLEHGANPHFQTPDGRDVLHNLMNRTINAGNRDAILVAIDRLLEYGANPNLPAAHRTTALHTLIQQMKYSDNRQALLMVLVRLLEKGANPSLQDADGTTPLHTLIDQMRYSEHRHAVLAVLVKLLDKEANPNLQDADGRSVLHTLMNQTIYVYNRKTIMAVLVALLLHGANPNLQDNVGQTALHILVKTTNMQADVKQEILMTLQQHGANTTALPDHNGYLALHYLGRRHVFDATIAFLIFRQMFQEGFLESD